MATELGTAVGVIRMEVSPALAALATVRTEAATTVGALRTTGRSAITIGTGLAGVGLAIGAAFGVAVSKTAELEKRLSFIKGITNANVADMEALRKTTIKLGQDSAFTALEVADGFTELAKAGATTKEIVGGMGAAIITLGQSSDIGLAKAATLIVSISSIYGLAAKDSSHIADIIQGAANASIISVEDMATSMKYVGSVAKNLGVSLEDTSTAIAVLGNAGIRGSTAGTGLRRILLNLTPATKGASAEMKKLGIITKDGSNEFYTAQGSAKKLSTIFQILLDKTKNLNPEQRQAAFREIFGVRAINSVIALSKGGAAAFDKMYAAVSNTSAAAVAAERLNNLAGAWEILKGSVDSALISVGERAQNPLRKIVVVLTNMVNAFTNASPAVQNFITKVVLGIGAATLFSGAFLIIVGTVLRAKAAFIELKDALIVARAAFLTSTGASTVLGGAFAALFSPIGIAIAAVAALVYLFIQAYKHSEHLRETIKAIGRRINDALNPALKDANGLWSTFVKFMKGLGGTILSEATKGFLVAADSILALVKGLTGVGETQGGIVGFFNNIGQKIREFVTKVKDAAIKIGESDWFKTLVASATYFVQVVIPEVVQKIKDFVGWVKGLKDTFVNSGFYAALIADGKYFVEVIIPYVRAKIEDFITWVKTVPDKIGDSDWFKTVKKFITDFVDTTVKYVHDKLKDFFDFLKQANHDLQNAEWFKTLKNDLSTIPAFIGTVKRVFQDIKDAIGKATQAVKDFFDPKNWGGAVFQAGLGLTAGAVGVLWLALKQLGDIFSPLKQIFNDTKDALERNLGGAFDRVKTALKNELLPAFEHLKHSITTDLLPALHQLADAFAPLLKILGGSLGAAIGASILAFAELIAMIISVAAGFVIAFSQTIGGVLAGFVTIFSGVIDTIAGLISFFSDLFTGNFDKLGRDLQAIWVGLWEVITGAVRVAVEIILAPIRAIVEGIISFFQYLYDQMVGHSIVPDLINAIIAWFVSLPGQVLSVIESFIKSVAGYFSTLGSEIAGAIGDVPGLLTGIFTSAISSLGGAAKGLYDGAKTLGSKIWDGFKKGMGINSPSFIEKAMTQMLANTKAGTFTLAGDIRAMQGLGAQIPSIIPNEVSTKLPAASLRSSKANEIAASRADAQAAQISKALLVNQPVGQRPISMHIDNVQDGDSLLRRARAHDKMLSLAEGGDSIQLQGLGA